MALIYESPEYNSKSTKDLIEQVMLNFNMLARLHAALREIKGKDPNAPQAKQLERQIDRLSETQERLVSIPRVEKAMRDEIKFGEGLG